jgi:hypothetical protein
MTIRVLGFDGDDTLWHNETRFNVTQSELRYPEVRAEISRNLRALADQAEREAG